MAVEALMALFLVIVMRLGQIIQQMGYETQETGVTPDTIRARLGLPPSPDPHHALAELFDTGT